MIYLSDYIKIFKAFTDKECDYILDCIQNNTHIDDFLASQTGSKQDGVVSDARTSQSANVIAGSELDNLLYDRVQKSYNKWLQLIPQQMAKVWSGYYFDLIDEGYQINRYTKSQYYDFHLDLLKDANHGNRVLSLCFYINDNYTGGELEFPFMSYKPTKGSAVVFPSTWLYPHRSAPIISGTKYSIVTWFLENDFVMERR